MEKKQTKNKGGRPPKFSDVNVLIASIAEYFQSCKSPIMPTKAGLCLHLNMSKDAYNDYRKREGFSHAIKEADLFMENAWVQRLGGNSPTGAIFYLKNAFHQDYKDKTESDITSGGQPIQISGMTISKDA